MPNRAERRRAARLASAPYRPPRGTVYDEFVGELRPPSDRAFTELHVRYGVKNGLYVDWTVTLQARLGDIEEFRESDGRLERRKLEVVDISDSAIRRHVYNPYQPDEPPQMTVLVDLEAGDEAGVDYEYQNQMNGLAARWAQKHAGTPEDRHTYATIGFITENRKPAIRDENLAWVRNTVVCIESDLADAVLSERAGFYFPATPSTAAVLRDSGQMQFIKVDPKGKLTPEAAKAALGDAADGTAKATGDSTMGMLVDSIYAGDWTGEIENFLN